MEFYRGMIALIKNKFILKSMTYPYLVSVLLPTRGRPEWMLKAVSSIITNAAHPEKVQILLNIDNDDINSYHEAYAKLEAITPNYKVIYSPRGLGYGDLHTHVNDLCAIAGGEYLFLWNDDALLMTPAWDEILEEHRDGLHGNPVAVIQIDNSDSWIYGFPFVHYDIYNAMGHFSLNAHNDTWMHEVANRSGVERIEWRIASQHNRIDLLHRFKRTDAATFSSLEDETYLDVWNNEVGNMGYDKTHILFSSSKEVELRKQDSEKVKKRMECSD